MRLTISIGVSLSNSLHCNAMQCSPAQSSPVQPSPAQCILEACSSSVQPFLEAQCNPACSSRAQPPPTPPPPLLRILTPPAGQKVTGVLRANLARHHRAEQITVVLRFVTL
uniref:Uncharacterized protein orf110 n=1 Tax=Chlorokybus atmophyticus TaxID=3144 RepID=A6YE75_CHLAT|nr:hypothetical protein Chatpmp03 [Chlorokybus atmophyticus]ABO15144.1 hypothetical protein [Chlorokybus atmophyticus]